MTVPFARTSNILFSIACLIVIAVGGLQLRDRLFPGPEKSNGTTIPKASLTEPPPNTLIDVSKVTFKRQATPAVVLLEFTDYECPFCARYAGEAYRQIQKAFVDRGLVAYGLFNHPLESIHKGARRASEAVECAGLQGKFWELHDVLFQRQPRFEREHLVAYASELEMDTGQFERCIDNGEMASRVAQHLEVARSAGVASTPSFLIGVFDSPSQVRILYRLRGALKFVEFEKALTQALDSMPTPR